MGIDMRFEAHTSAARAEIAKLAAEMKSIQKLNTAYNNAASMALMQRFDTGIRPDREFNLRGPMADMDALTRKIQKGKITAQEWKDTLRGTNKLFEYQNSLQQASLASMQKMGNGRYKTGLSIPELNAGNDALRTQAVRLAAAAEASKAYGRSVMDLGKNMAFMGRQAMLSVTAPTLLVAGGAAAVAYKADQQLTDLAKVYGESDAAFSASAESIKASARGLASEMNRQYAISMTDTLDLAKAFAALGEQGENLDRMVDAAARLMRLGDVNVDSALGMISNLRTAFQLEGEGLQNAVNMANTFENSSTLTMQDFADALPKLGSIVKSWGGDVAEAGVILEGFTRSGIPAVEGANALKSGFTKLVRPTEKLVGKFKEFSGGLDLNAIVKEMDGNVPLIVKRIGEIQEAQNWDPIKRKNFAAELWGAYQLNRGMALTENLAKPTKQMQKILELMEKAKEDGGAALADYNKMTADREVAVQMQSSSAQFKKVINEIQIAAEQIGAKILPVITGFLNTLLDSVKGVYKVVKGVTDALGPLGTALKYLAAGAGVFMAAFGPVLLLLSSGALIKGGLITGMGVLTGLMAKMRGKGGDQPLFQTAAQRAAALQEKALTENQAAQARATQALTTAVNNLNNAYSQTTRAASASAASSTRNTNSAVSNAQRLATATNTQVSALNNYNRAQQQAARLGGRVLANNPFAPSTGTTANSRSAHYLNNTAVTSQGAAVQDPEARRTSNSIVSVAGPGRSTTSPSRSAFQSAGMAAAQARRDAATYTNTFNAAARPIPNTSGFAQAAAQATTGLNMVSQSTQNILDRTLLQNSALASQLRLQQQIGTIVERNTSFVSRGTAGSAMGNMSESQRRQAAGIGLLNQQAAASSRSSYDMNNAYNSRMAQVEAEAHKENKLRRAEEEAHAENALRNQERARIAQADLNERYKEGAQRIGSMAAGMSMLGSMIAPAGSAWEKLFLVMMGVSTVAMMMPGLFAKIATVATTGFGKAAGKIGLNVGTITSSLTGLAGSLAGPLIAVAGAGLAAWGVYRMVSAEARQYREEQEKIAKSTEGWANVLGYTKLQFGQVKNAAGEVVDTVESIANNMKDDEFLGPLVEDLKNNSTDIAYLTRQLENESVKLYADGANPQQVQTAIEAMLNAANISPEIEKELLIRFKNVTPTGMNDKSLSDTIRNRFSELWMKEDGMTASFGDQQWGKLDKAAGDWQQRIKNDTGSYTNQSYDLSEYAKQELNKTINEIELVIRNAKIEEKPAFIKSYFDSIKNEINEAMKGLTEDQRKAIEAQGGLDNITQQQLQGIGIDEDKLKNLQRQKVILDNITLAMKNNLGYPEQFAFAFRDLDSAMALWGANANVAIMDFDQVMKIFNESIKNSEGWDKLDENAKKSLISYLRAAAGLSTLDDEALKAAVSQGNIGANIAKTAAEADAATKEVEDLNAALGDKNEENWKKTIIIDTQFAAPYLNEDFSRTVEDMVNQRKDVMSKTWGYVVEDMAAQAQIQWDAEKRAFQDMQKAAQDALKERQDAESKGLELAQKNEKKAFDKGWEKRMKDEEKSYDDRIKAIEDTQEAEDDLERMRKRNAERESRRQKYLQSLMQTGLDINIALAGGNLDEVGRLSINAATAATDYNRETVDAEAGYMKEDSDIARRKEIQTLQDEKQARMEWLQEQRDLEREAMEERLAQQQEELRKKQEAETAYLQRKQQDEQIANEIIFQQNQRRLNRELDALKAAIPLSVAEMQGYIARMDQKYAEYGVVLDTRSQGWAKGIEEDLGNAILEAGNRGTSEQQWIEYGNRIGEGIAQGGMRMNLDEFYRFLRTGDMPGLPATNPEAIVPIRHGGGPLSSDKYNNRAGIPRNAPLRSNEVYGLLQRQEYVMQESAHRKYGTEAMNAVNQGNAMIIRHGGGPVAGGIGQLGVAMQGAYMGALMAKATLAAGQAMMQARMYAGGGSGETSAVPLPGGGYKVSANGGTAILSTEAQVSMWNAIHKAIPSAAPTSGTRYQDVGSGYDRHMQGLALDLDGNKPQIAEWIYRNYPDSAELIYGPGPLLYNKGGKKITDQAALRGVYAGDLPGHYDHVHWSVNGPLGASSAPSGEDISKKFPQYAGWTTAGIQQYGRNAAAMMQAKYGYSSDGSAAIGDFSKGNQQFYIKEIVDEAKRRGLTKRGAVIALMTALQESTMRMLANYAVPASLNYPHDGIGDDHDSIGLFQQRDNGGWGTVAQRMNARASAGMFYNKLAQFDYNSMDPGAAAQRVQVSAYPAEYSKWFGTASGMANQYFDKGGIARGLGYMPKNVISPERVLSPQQTKTFDNLIPILSGLANMGIVGYDDIINNLVQDGLNLAKSGTVSANVPVEGGIEVHVTIKDSTIVGVDDLDRRLKKFGDEIVERVEAERRRAERRVGGK